MLELLKVSEALERKLSESEDERRVLQAQLDSMKASADQQASARLVRSIVEQGGCFQQNLFVIYPPSERSERGIYCDALISFRPSVC